MSARSPPLLPGDHVKFRTSPFSMDALRAEVSPTADVPFSPHICSPQGSSACGVEHLNARCCAAISKTARRAGSPHSSLTNVEYCATHILTCLEFTLASP